MPNAKVLSEKQAIVAALTERIKNASSGVFVDYKGINVEQDTQLRSEMRKNDVEYTVVKNTLTRFAANNCDYEALDPVLNGTTALATSTGDPVVPFRILNEQSKKFDGFFTIKAAFMNGKLMSDAEIQQIAELPSMNALYAQVFGTMLAPITSLAVVLNQIAEKGGSAAAAPAAEAAPAEEAAPAQAEAAAEEITPAEEPAE